MAKDQLGADLISQELLKRYEELIKLAEQFNVETKKTVDELLKAQKAFDKTSDSQKELADKEKELTQIEKNLQKAEKLQKGELDELVKSKLKLSQATKETNARLREQMGITNQSGSFMNKLTGAVRGGIAQFALIAGAITGALTVLKKFGTAIINSSDYLRDTWDVAVNQSKAAFDVFKQSIATLDFSNFFTNMRDAVILAEEYTRGMQKIEDQMRSLGIQEIKNQGELARLKKIYTNVKLSIDERTDALKEYQALVLKVGTKETELTKAQYDLELKTAAQRTGLTEKEIQNFIELNDEMSAINQTAIELSENQVSLGPLGQWRFFVKTITGTVNETVAANDKLITELKKAGIEGEKAFSFAEKLKKLSPEQIKNLENFSKAYYSAQNKFDESTTRQEAIQNRLENTASKKAVTLEESAAEKRARLLAEFKKSVSDLSVFEYQQNKNTLEENEKYNQMELDADKALRDYQEQFITDLAEKEKNATEESLQNDLDAIDEKLKAREELIQFAELGFNTLASLESSLFDLRSNNAESEISGLEKKRDAEIAAAEQAGRSTIAIEEKYQKKEAALKKKQAEREKKHAIVQSIIQTALSVTAALASVPPNVPLSIANGIVGGIQTGVIAAQKIPEFFKGTEFMPKDTLGTIAERGAEAYKIPGKNWDIAYNKSMGYFPRGTKILTHEQTKEKVNDLNLDLTPLLIEQRKTRNAMRTEIFDPKIMKMVMYTDKTRQILLSRRFE